ncbi:ankyrin repeat domain-containing protein [Gelidibacter gilvus]|uniref:Ankyrin repeat domain-containing protein n=1 Tax=Gelidibacter gilvus TaxID=59602 RepID=A0A4Q0XGC7_9FLAO|nr:ankyrin repeat domain-containing protein [Gelidibacter gilvus]
MADGNGTTALHYAILSSDEAVVKLLVDAYADVAFKDKRGNFRIDYGNMVQNQTIINLLKKNKI